MKFLKIASLIVGILNLIIVIAGLIIIHKFYWFNLLIGTIILFFYFKLRNNETLR